MLYVSLVVSGLLLLAANWAVRSKHPVAGTFGVGAVAVVGPMCLMLTLPAVVLQAVLVCAALLVLLARGRDKRLYLPVSVAVTLVAYGVVTWYAVDRQQQLRKQFPVESLEDRLPPRPSTGQPTPVHSARLDNTETLLDMEDHFMTGWRNRALRRLHEDKVDVFVNSYGFGVGRVGLLNEATVLQDRHDRQPVPQPEPGPDVSPPDKWEPATGPGFDGLHTASVLDFLNPAGFGLVQDRQHVTGFQRHGFSKVPDPADRWAVGRVDLVGLLLHPEPVAYVSANLPRMDELRAAPTRPLDPFEAAGLTALRRGDDLFVRGTDRQVRMVGSIRATKQCLACHGGDRGDLLGAFSYTLRRGE